MDKDNEFIGALTAKLHTATDDELNRVAAILFHLTPMAAPPPTATASVTPKKKRAKRFVDKHGLHFAMKDYLAAQTGMRAPLDVLETAMRDKGKLQPTEPVAVMMKVLNKSKPVFRVVAGIVMLIAPPKPKEAA